MPKRSITLTLQEWKNLRYWLPNPDYVGITGEDPEPYECIQKLCTAIDNLSKSND